MKITLLVFCLLLTTAAFGQYGGSITSQAQIYHAPDHPAHASYAQTATEQSVVGGGGYTLAQGDRPASDFPQIAQQSLGDAARALRKQHEQVQKARIVWTNQ
ncbi:MAG: hypothetical protein WCC04_15115 [Terriglobales bacterium]